MLAVDATLHDRLRQVREVLMYSFDLEILDVPLGPAAYQTPSPWLPAFQVIGADYAVFGRDATGGVYVASEQLELRTRFCHHIDTQGHAVLLAEDLGQLVSLILELPYWREILMQAADHTPSAFRAAAAQLEREVLEDLPALTAAREDLLSSLQLPRLADPARHLHEWTSRTALAVSIVSPHGWEYQPLGTFVH